MKSAYQTLLSALQSRYEPREAQALSRYVLEEVFDLNFTDVCMGKDTQFSAEAWCRLENILSRLVAGEPLQYVLGTAHFYGLTFKVNTHTLIPRPETEDLVTYLLKHRADWPPRVLDVGTGSGCIALSVKAHWTQANVRAWDISEGALTVAQQNAKDLGLEVTWEQQDLLSQTSLTALPAEWQGQYVLVSNPPYVMEAEKTDMAAHVLEHEPHTALFVPDNDPLRFYTALANLAEATQPVAICCEINTALGKATAECFRAVGYTQTQVCLDRFDRPRFVVAEPE